MTVGAEARIGMSGWVYPPWRGEFYPVGLRQADELAYAASRVGSIEINGSFYSLQKPASWARWNEATPTDFVFSVKAPRLITHVRRLEGVARPLANFFASGLLTLGPKLGAVLWQFPPSLGYDAGMFEDFFAQLPRTAGEAARLAAGHDEWMSGRTAFEIERDRPLRHAVEIRSRSFERPEWTALLERHAIASVTADTAGKWPRIDEVTADFAYARLHGDRKLYESGYDAAGLDRWESWVRGHLDEGRDVYVYFDNDVKVRAPFDAMALIERLRR